MVQQPAKKATAIARRARVGMETRFLNKMEFRVIKNIRTKMIMENNTGASIATSISTRAIMQRTMLTHQSKGRRRDIIAIITILMRSVTIIRKLNIIIIKKYTPVLEWKKVKAMVLVARISITKVDITQSRAIEESRSSTAVRKILMNGNAMKIIMNICETITMIRDNINIHHHRRVDQELSPRAKMLRIVVMEDRINTTPSPATSSILLTVRSHSKTFRHCVPTSPRTSQKLPITFTTAASTSTTKTT